jgi:hypothetical protein
MYGEETDPKQQWGNAPHFTTDRECIEARKLGFHLSELPKTLHDAVIIARHMGLRYLWIDSLCICQDDVEDWARESARMCNVYSNASFVIAANHAENNSVGCFHTREHLPKATITLSTRSGNEEDKVLVQALLLLNQDEYSWAAGGFEHEPLSKRGWGLQERVLAKRVLHYNTRKMYFECNQGIIGEDGYHDDQRLCLLSRNEQSQEEKADRKWWNHLLWTYGDRKLTKPTDKLPAMSGLAKLFEQRLGAKYIVGLWSDDLIEGLAWQGLGSKRVFSELSSEYTGPSWSWANYDGIAATGVSEKESRDIAEIKDWSVELKTDANPYGEVKDAWIRIWAPMTKLSPSPLETNDHEIRLRRAGLNPHPRMCTRYSDDENGTIVTLDHRVTEKSDEWRQWDLELLILKGYLNERKEGVDGKPSSSEESDVFSHYYCLVVQKISDGEGTERRRRIGWVFLDGDEAAKVREDNDNWTTVTLV